MARYVVLAYATVVLMITAFVLSACSTEVYPRHALVEQILKPRAGHKGLTNRVCLEYSGDTCVRDEIVEYFLTDSQFRKTAADLGFVCKVGEKRYKICRDEPGFCRTTYRKQGFLGLRKEKVVEFLPVDNYDFLIAAKTRCFQKDRYNFLDL